MGDQSENLALQPPGCAELDEAMAADPRKLWKSPQVIVGTLDRAEAAVGTHADANSLS
jgi:hypothetical protein